MLKIFSLIVIYLFSTVVVFFGGVTSVMRHGFEEWLEMLAWISLFALTIGGWTWCICGFRPWTAAVGFFATVAIFLLGRILTILAVCAGRQEENADRISDRTEEKS